MDAQSARDDAIRAGRYLSLGGSIASAQSYSSTRPNVWKPLPAVALNEAGSVFDEDPSQTRAAYFPPERTTRPSLYSIPSTFQDHDIERQAIPTARIFRSPWPPPRPYHGVHAEVPAQFGPTTLPGNPGHAPPPPTKQPTRTARAFRTSLHSIATLGLTPGDILYPAPSFYRPFSSTAKAERTLGLTNRVPTPPPHQLSTIPLPPHTLPIHRTSTATREDAADAVDPVNGRTAWLHALAAFLVVFNCWGLNNAFGVFQYYYGGALSASPSAVSWIGSAQLALVFGLGVPIGRAVDAGYFRVFFNGGSVLLVLGVFATAWCRRYWELFLVQGILTGLGMGAVFCSGIVVLMSWFDERKMGVAMGLGAAGSCVGGIVYSVLAQRLLERKGFAFTVRMMGVIALATMVPPNVVFRLRRVRHRKHGRQRSGSHEWKLDWRVFCERAYLLTAGGMFFAFLGVYFGFVYMISYATSVLHLPPSSAITLLIYMNISNIPGRFLPALISDRCIGPLNTIIPSTLLSSAIIWLWTASTISRGSLTAIACFYGFASAGVQVLYAPTVHSVCLTSTTSTKPRRSSSPLVSSDAEQAANDARIDKMGLKAGGIFTVIGLACLVGTPIGGALIAYREDRGLAQPYLGAQLFAGVSLALAACLLLAARVAKAGWEARRA
ncbi:hypothetical protein LTR50_001593 [Elasticomyces elasticus]|nr:hypothetical protein LTR50_001593 [Elasticomyces elasticus]